MKIPGLLSVSQAFILMAYAYMMLFMQALSLVYPDLVKLRILWQFVNYPMVVNPGSHMSSVEKRRY